VLNTGRVSCSLFGFPHLIFVIYDPAVAIPTVVDEPGSTFMITALVANRTYPKVRLHPIEFLRNAVLAEDKEARASQHEAALINDDRPEHPSGEVWYSFTRP
jgi:hypothetical protein